LSAPVKAVKYIGSCAVYDVLTVAPAPIPKTGEAPDGLVVDPLS